MATRPLVQDEYAARAPPEKASDQVARVALRSHQRTMLGMTLTLLASQIVVSVRVPRTLGFVMALSGIAYIAQGTVVGAEGFSSNGTIPGLAASVLDLAWMIWLVVVAWQKPSVLRPVVVSPVEAS
jgi:Domain of unknown function (DUF4386)